MIMIEKMSEEHLDEVMKIEEEAFSVPWSRKSIQDASSKSENIYLVAKTDKVVGYIGIWTSFETADLCHIAVLTSHRNQKIGNFLLKEAVKICAERKVERILLEVRESNTYAKALYTKNGFHEIGKRIGYYFNPDEDAILMEMPVIPYVQAKETSL